MSEMFCNQQRATQIQGATVKLKARGILEQGPSLPDSVQPPLLGILVNLQVVPFAHNLCPYFVSPSTACGVFSPKHTEAVTALSSIFLKCQRLSFRFCTDEENPVVPQ